MVFVDTKRIYIQEHINVYKMLYPWFWFYAVIYVYIDIYIHIYIYIYFYYMRAKSNRPALPKKQSVQKEDNDIPDDNIDIKDQSNN